MPNALHILLILVMGLAPMAESLAACCLPSLVTSYQQESSRDVAIGHCHDGINAAVESPQEDASPSAMDGSGSAGTNCPHSATCCGVSAAPVSNTVTGLAHQPKIDVGYWPEPRLPSIQPERLLRPPSTS